jgi:hypothetical protein
MSKYAVKRHFKEKHGNRPPIKRCSGCGKLFDRSYQKKQHELTCRRAIPLPNNPMIEQGENNLPIEM